ncbi:HNH endonuclease [Nocardia sp. 004]|uniref:HNH endonuclease n=1 Tax=Nocardia sp. 004 TaxID=3385978 RepID=UPI0039A00812
MIFRHATKPIAPTAANWVRSSVLVVNASYEALTEIRADRAVTLLVTGVAESIADHEPHFPIRSQHRELFLPQTIKLLRYVYLEYTALVHDESKATQAGVLRRDRHRCGYCASSARTVDHIRPRSQGGPNTWSNLVACCVPCNTAKADRTPEEAGMRLLWQPTAPTHRIRQQRRIWKQLAGT